MANPYKAHIDFEEDVSDFLSRISIKTGFSKPMAAHMLMRLIEKAEVTIDLTLKDNAQINSLEGKPPVKFKKRINLKIQI